MPLPVERYCIAIAISFALASSTALAQGRTAQFELNLPEQVLANSLRAVGRAAHVNIVFDPATAAGRRAPALSGKYTPDEALERLLVGSGLIVRLTPGGSFAVEALQLPAAASASEQQHDGEIYTFDPLLVIGKVEGFSATRTPTALKDIPQSVSVIDQQTLREQNAHDLAKAFNWATGVTLTTQSSTNNSFYTRGFPLLNFHIDGSAQLTTGTNYSQLGRLDLSQYESVELLRGADALFGGVGAPGGSINLTRKRPLPERSVAVAVSAGSWDTYRVEADINTGNITDSGRLRGRLVAVNESEHYFYDTAERRMNKLYAVAEYDLSPRTRVRLGGTSERTPDYVGFNSGLPRYFDGRDAKLPRSTALTFPWAKNHSTRKESFLQLDHAFNERWKLRAGVSRIEQEQDANTIDISSPIDPASRTLVPLFSPSPLLFDSGSLAQRKTTADLTLTGSFDWNGRVQEVALGFDGSRMNSNSDTSRAYLMGPPIEPSRFDPTNYPVQVLPDSRSLDLSNSRERGVFASIKLRPADGWAITVGARNSSVRSHDTTQNFFVGEASPYYASTGDLSMSGLVTPYLGFVYEISPTYSLYASYADTGEVSRTRVTTDGKQLDAPRGANQELGLKAGWNEGRLNGSLALFNIDKTDVPIRDPRVRPGLRPGCCFIPTTQRSKGFEAELSGLLMPNWTMNAGYTFNLNRSGDGTVLNTVTPKHLLKLWSNYRLPGPAQAWSIGGGIIAQSKNYNEGMACTAFDPVEGCIGEFVPFRAEQGFYSVTTLRVDYRVNERWNLALNVDNLFDRHYYQTVGGTSGGNWYGAPRNWMLTLRGEF